MGRHGRHAAPVPDHSRPGAPDAAEPEGSAEPTQLIGTVPTEPAHPDPGHHTPAHQPPGHRQPLHPEADHAEFGAVPRPVSAAESTRTIDALLESAASHRRRRPGKAKRRRQRRRTIVVLAALILFIGAAVALALSLRSILGLDEIKDYAGPGDGQVTFTIEAGSGPLAIGSGLQSADIVANADRFLATYTAQAQGREIQPGKYQLRYRMSSSAAVAALLQEDGAKVHYAAINQNLRQGEVFAALSKATQIPVSDFEVLAKTPQKFGLPAKAPSLEGYLAPGEYRFATDMTATQILQEMVNDTLTELKTAGVTKPDDQFRVVTIASIVEFEGNKANYAKISGAIDNRLNRPNAETRGFLNSDATVIYGLNRKSYEITDAEKQDKSNKYNTFANPGLPVGPIGSPAKAAIDAAAHPEKNNYYYWVTVNLDTGETLYATTYDEHLKNVAKYTAWCGSNPGKCS